MTAFPLGAFPSPPDPHDFDVKALLSDPPSTFAPMFYTYPIPLVATQTGGTCVGFGATGMRLQQEWRQNKRWYPLDPYWLYRECKKIDGIPNVEGTYIRAAMSVLRHKGQAETNGGNIAKHKIGAYYTVKPQINDIKSVLTQLGALVIGLPWYESWFTPDASKGFILPKPSVQAGGHAILVTGWDDARGFLLQNSWGKGWGSTGRCFLPYEYLPKVYESWKAIDV